MRFHPPNMTTEHWQLLQSIFHEIVDLDDGAQTAYLNEHYPQEPKLRHELAALINKDKTHKNRIKTTIEREVTHALRTDISPGERIGAYKILSEIGHGGMGTAYLAERADEEFNKQVAIKLMRYTFNTEEEKQSFRDERQLLANLEHPNIARLLDGGTRENGSPYIVMEYIKGVPIDVYCEHNHLSVKERLQLFLQVCEAVEYAHQHHILHLDIKPSNILVNEERTPKLLDFGIAKPSTVKNPANETDIRSTDARILTPEYASPEQINGQHLSNSSDVYSLGILLYELVTGINPYHLQKDNTDNIEFVDHDIDFQKPSDITDNKKQKHELHGDLDEIIMKAINNTTTNRYASVSGFAEDILRFFNKQPVKARSTSLLYRFSRNITRYKTTIIPVVLLVLTLVLIANLVTVKHQHQKLVQDIISKHTSPSNTSIAPTVLIMPFANSNNKSDKNYFGLGLSNDLITDLSRLDNIQVLSITSAASFQNTRRDPVSIARDLKANYIVHGSVFVDAENISIDIKLTNTETENKLWEKKITTTIDELFTLQNTLAITIAQSLNIILNEQQAKWLKQDDTHSFEAYDIFLRGLSEYTKSTANANQKAREHFEKAINIDPAFARAYATLANTHRADSINGWTKSVEKSLSRAEILINKALTLDDRSPQIHFVMGLVLREKRRHKEALAYAAQAIALNPNYADSFVLMASILCYSGTPENSIPLIKKAIRLNPKSPSSYSFHLGQCHYIQNNFKKAISAFEQSLQRNPTSQRSNLWLAASYAQNGNRDNADWTLNEILITNPDLNIQSVSEKIPFTDSSAHQSFVNGLKKAGLK